MRLVLDFINRNHEGNPLKRNLSFEQKLKVEKAIQDLLDTFNDVDCGMYQVNENVPNDELSPLENTTLLELKKSESEGGFMYFDIHVGGDESFSVPLKAHHLEIDANVPSDDDVINLAVLKGLIDSDDTNYVDNVTEIDVHEFLQLKSTEQKKY